MNIRTDYDTKPATDHLYECDCCGIRVPREQIAFVVAYGIDTTACDNCRGMDETLNDIEFKEG